MKTKPTQIIVHRIELQQFERNILDNLQTAVIADKLTSPIIKVITSKEAMAALTIAYLTYRYGEAAQDYAFDKLESGYEILQAGIEANRKLKEAGKESGLYDSGVVDAIGYQIPIIGDILKFIDFAQ